MRKLGVLMIGCLFLAGCPAGDDMDNDNVEPTNDNVAMNDNVATNDNGDGMGAVSSQFQATLSGDNEVPSITSNVTGTATLTLSEDGSTLDYTVTVDGDADVNITMAHIHLGGADVNGAVVAFLFDPETAEAADNLEFSGSLTAADLVADLAGMDLSELVANLESGGAYVNVHSEGNEGGEVRGQIGPVDG